MAMLAVNRCGARLYVDAPAKINVGLRVLGRRPDGYHELESLVMAVSLADRLEVAPAVGDELSLEVQHEGAEAPADDSNLVLRAARLLRSESGAVGGARLILRKRIPAGRGLGGGSSDAAAALTLLSHFWQINYNTHRLASLGAKMGSDVPFFLNGPLAIIRGRGEVVQPIDHKVNVWIVLLVPPFELATQRVYNRFTELPLTTRLADARLALESLVRGQIGELGKYLVNDLEPAAQALNAEMLGLRRLLEDTGASCVSMTGSGSAVYALAADERGARELVRALRPGTGTGVYILTPWNDQKRCAT